MVSSQLHDAIMEPGLFVLRSCCNRLARPGGRSGRARRIGRCLFGAEPAVDEVVVHADPPVAVGYEQRDHFRDFFRLAETAERDHAGHRFGRGARSVGESRS